MMGRNLIGSSAEFRNRASVRASHLAHMTFSTSPGNQRNWTVGDPRVGGWLGKQGRVQAAEASPV